ncbi:MAG: DJ-1/PfpI family protein [Aquincola sp.]|nr:DJ-1/PfpI family protein [Aquincola sp.]MDH4287111.1 DJ-1/PfpI family protein [Aquincola sp.]MDH5328713.1 DJ-1/PfpI family protein [Aquincola sp.]
MNVGILVFTAVEELGFVGPWEMLGMWGAVTSRRPPILVAQAVQPVRCAKGLTVLPDHGFDDCPPLDVLVVPGGQGTRRAVDNPVLIDFIAQRAAAARHVLSVCTGAFLLHKAGLLAGRSATTHWASLDRLRELGDVRVLEQRYVVDGPIWTSAGVSAGIDMTLEFISRVDSPAVAGKVQLVAEYYPEDHRYGGGIAHREAPDYVQVVPRHR